jgi:hypothetical protein
MKSLHYQDSNSDPLVFHPVIWFYTDCAAAAGLIFLFRVDAVSQIEIPKFDAFEIEKIVGSGDSLQGNIAFFICWRYSGCGPVEVHRGTVMLHSSELL